MDVHGTAARSAFSGDPRASADRIQLRRALTLTLMTLVMPGSAQLVTGHRTVGRIAIRVWIACLAIGGLLLLLALTSREHFLQLALDPRTSTLGRWFLILGALAWVLLLLDAWRLGRPLQMPRKHRLWMTGVNAALCFGTAGVMFFAAHLVSVQNGFVGTVFASETTTKPHDGRYNVLLMGTDSGRGRFGMRPDSMTVASIDAETGRTVLIGMPRNLQDIRFPKGSFMKKAFPDTFDCDGCYLNAVNTYANDHAKELGATSHGQRTPGIQATMDAISEATGLKLNYYALVNMGGFARLIDAVGGVTVNVRQRTAIGGVTEQVRGYIEPGVQKLSGDQALWYSRSRVQNNDFSRMGRQKCVMSAMLHELSPQKVLLKVNAIAKSSTTLLDTDIPRSDLATFVDLALKARSEPVATVSLVPPVIYTGNPDWDKVRRLVSRAVDKAEGKTVRTKVAPTSGLLHARLKTLDPAPAPVVEKDPLKANQSSNLAAAC